MSLITGSKETISEFNFLKFITYNIGDITYHEVRIISSGILYSMRCFCNSELIFEFVITPYGSLSLSCNVSGIDI